MSFLRNILLFLAPISLLSGESLYFTNGDLISGKPARVEEGFLYWNSQVFGSELRAPVDELEKVELAPTREERMTFPLGYADVYMNRGDVFKGLIKKVKDDEILLSTDWAGEFPVKRSMIEKIRFSDGQVVYYKESGNIDDWVSVPNRKKWFKWVGEDVGIGVRGRGAICREVTLGEVFKVNFKIKMDGTPRVRFLFLATEGEVYEPESYLEVVLQSRNLTSRLRAIGDSESVGQYNFKEQLPSGREVEFTYYFDLEKNLLSIYSEGKEVTKWNLPEEIQAGNWLYLYSEYNGDVYINDLLIKSWNGALPTSSDDVSDILIEEEKPVVYLNNGDVLGAELGEVKGKKFSFSSEMGELTVPLDKLQKIDFSGMPYDEAKREAKDVRLKLFDKSLITMQLIEWGNDEVKGVSEQVGEITVKVSDIAEAEFNLYE